jgi:mannosyltransferase OCH1-like enzyme
MSYPKSTGGNVERLRSLNPDWKHVIWSDADLRGMCQRLGKKYLKCYDSYKYMHQKIDFGRCVALWMHGGISVDMDVYALQPFDRLPFVRSQVLVVGQNPLPTGALENWMSAHARFAPEQCNVLVSQAIAGHALSHRCHGRHRVQNQTHGNLFCRRATHDGALVCITRPFETYADGCAGRFQRLL